MKIFLSYGHDKASEGLVKRLKTDLENLGHDVWLDRERIEFGDDWRREITDGIKDRDQVLALLSRHSTRDPGVCREEIAIALGAGKAYVCTILVEAEKEVSPPLSVSHLQWLDMHDWRERQAQDEAAFEVWYQQKFVDIRRVMETPDATRFAGEISELEIHLKPIDCTPDIVTRVQSFTGRHWLFKDIEAWRTGDRKSRVFWLTGAPGTGKSAVAAWLAHAGRSHVLAAQFCRYNRRERRDPLAVIRSIAFQLATRLPDYRRHLVGQPEIGELGGKKAGELFDYLLANPLRYAIDGGRERLLIVIDALDETLEEGHSELLDLIAEDIEKLPDWIGLVVTSRPEPVIRRQLEAFGIHELASDDPRNLADVKQYAERWLQVCNLDPESSTRTLDAVLKASEGNFLYLCQLRDAVENKWVDLADMGNLPRGLAGLYERYFKRQFPDVAAYETDTLPLLEIILAARRPVPADEAAAILGWSGRQRARRVESLGSLFTESKEGIAPFHKSIRDWLTDERTTGPDYYADPDEGHRRLGRALWEQFTEMEHPEKNLSDFTKDELPYQLSCWPDKELLALIGQDAAERYREVAGLIAQWAKKHFEWTQALDWQRFALRLCELCLGPEHPETATSLSDLAGLLVYIHFLGARFFEEARPLYERALVIREKVLGSEHSATLRVMDSLGLLQINLGDYDKARILLEQRFKICEKTFGPDDFLTAESLISLACLFNEIGNYDKARRLLEQVLETHDKEAGGNSLAAWIARNNLNAYIKRLNDRNTNNPAPLQASS